MTFEEGSQGAFDRRRCSDQGRSRCLWVVDGRHSGVCGSLTRDLKACDFRR